MPTIDIIIRNKTASAVNPPCIVCGNSDYNVKFDFDEEWQAHNNKIGVFAYNRCGEWQSEKVLFEGDTCPVPALHGVRSVWIGVTAGDVRTSTPADVPCRMGATDFSDTTEKPSADVWGQILAKLDELQTEIDEIKAGGVGGTDISLGVTATVGQTIKVKAVDADGKPTAWAAVDMATGDTEVWEELTHFVGTADSPVNSVKQTFPAGAYKKIYIVGHIVLSGTNNPVIFIDSDVSGAPKVFTNQSTSGTFRVLIETFGTGVAVHRTGRTPDNQYAWNGSWDTTTKNDTQMINIAFVELFSGHKNTTFSEGTDFTIYGVKA